MIGNKNRPKESDKQDKQEQKDNRMISILSFQGDILKENQLQVKGRRVLQLTNIERMEELRNKLKEPK